MMNVSRVDCPRAHGWQFRVECRHFVVRKFFSDSKHGGKRKARRAAERFARSVDVPEGSRAPGQIGVLDRTARRAGIL